jgi:prepilin-type N-terminal cleavage/methylation domain-containing protein
MNSTRTVRSLLSAARRGFSMVELLIALTISGTLMAGMMVALDVMFKRYTVISDQASTHVIARVVMHRILSMIRTGTEFGPYPTDVYDRTQNPANYDRIQFVSFDDPAADRRDITTIETREAGNVTVAGVATMQRGPRVLWLVVESSVGGVVTRTERPLMDGVVAARFNMEYDPGPRLRRATVDLTFMPQGNTVAETNAAGEVTRTMTDADGNVVDRTLMFSDAGTPLVRLISTAAPRGED